MKKRRNPTHVYLARGNNNLYKIGCSNNPEKRIKQLNLELIDLIESKQARELERSIHFLFDEYRERGEYFYLDSDSIKQFSRLSDNDIVSQQDRVTISAQVSPSLEHLLRIKAAQNGISKSEAIRQAIIDWINNRDVYAPSIPSDSVTIQENV